MPGRIAVVDLDNRFLRWEERKVIHQERLDHRSIHVLVFDSQDRLVLQRRHPGKDTFPSHWDTSCAGHVEESDYTGGPDDDLDAVYRDVAARELSEELGLSTPLEELAHFGPEPGVHYEQIRLYRTTSDGPYVLQEDEVTEVRALTPTDYAALVEEDDVTPTVRYFVAWLGERGLWRP